MRKTIRTLGVALLTVLSALLMGQSGSMPLAVQLTGTHALKGTQIPILNITSDPAIQGMAIQYGVGSVGTPPTVVVYPASWRPLSPGGFSDPTWDQSVREGVAALQLAIADDSSPSPVIFGYSQGAVVGSEYKKAFNANPTPGVVPNFVFVGNGNRPGGGILSRMEGLYIPGLDMTFTSPTPTHTSGAGPGVITTKDYAGQYDPIADAPTNPANLFSLANAAMGALFVHLNYDDPSGAVLQDEYGDTAYYLIPSYPVPLLMPIDMIPVVGPIAADMLDPLVRLLVEAGYNRNSSPGQPAGFDFGYFPDPAAFVKNIPVAIITGLDNGLQDIGAGRPLNTARPQIGPGTTGQGAYGIGGPPVTMNPTTNAQPLAVTTMGTEVQQSDNGQALLTTPPAPMADVGSGASNNSNGSGPKLNVWRPPLFATPGGNSSTTSKPRIANPAGSLLATVRKSIKAVVKAVTSPGDSPTGQSEPGQSDQAPADSAAPAS
jgi:hypothetical protein